MVLTHHKGAAFTNGIPLNHAINDVFVRREDLRNRWRSVIFSVVAFECLRPVCVFIGFVLGGGVELGRLCRLKFVCSLFGVFLGFLGSEGILDGSSLSFGGVVSFTLRSSWTFGGFGSTLNGKGNLTVLVADLFFEVRDGVLEILDLLLLF